MRLLPATLSTRLLLAMFGTILVAQLVGSAVFFYDRQFLTAQWSALFWSERVSDLVRILDTLDRPQRGQVLATLVPRKTVAQPVNVVGDKADLTADDDFIRLFQERIARLRQQRGAVDIEPAHTGSSPDVELGMLPDLRAKGPARLYDVRVAFTDGTALTLRLQVVSRRIPESNAFYVYTAVLICVLFVGALVVARGITVPLSRLVAAADALGRGLPQAPLKEQGPRELQRAARAFNSMQDRLHRYLDSRTRVLAAMSHDLRTPITRMLLRTEAIADPSLQGKVTQDLEEMQVMVQGALDMLQGLESTELVQRINIEALLLALRDDYAELGFTVTVSGAIQAPLAARPQALRRLLTNLLDNARKFASHAWLDVSEDARDVTFRVRDDGPGIPDDQLERVMEPYYRLESSRGRTTGGTGLGLSIARDIAQGHGGRLRLVNSSQGGLEARVTIPRNG
jgi:signal transduction histidine kinase